MPFNQSWAASASALVVFVSNSLMRPPGADKDVPSYSHSFDAGTASGYFALQANRMGWHVHGMVGLDMDRAFAELNVPVGHRVEAAYAVVVLEIRRPCPKPRAAGSCLALAPR